MIALARFNQYDYTFNNKDISKTRQRKFSAVKENLKRHWRHRMMNLADKRIQREHRCHGCNGPLPQSSAAHKGNTYNYASLLELIWLNHPFDKVYVDPLYQNMIDNSIIAN